MSAGDLALERRGRVAVATLRRPPNNHVDLEPITALGDALEEAARDCRAVVLASEGRNFCGGADLQQPRGLASGDGGGLGPFYEAALRIFAAPLPLVAAVQGAAVGAGLDLRSPAISGWRGGARALRRTSLSWASIQASASASPCRVSSAPRRPG